MGLSGSQMGAALGVTAVAVNEAARRGRISREPDGTFDPEKVKVDWEENANHKQRSRRIGKSAKSDGTGSDSFLEAQRQREWLRVEKEELELRARAGELVEISEVELRWSAIVAAARNRALLLPAKTAPKVAVTTDVRECQAILDREIREILRALADKQDEQAA